MLQVCAKTFSLNSAEMTTYTPFMKFYMPQIYDMGATGTFRLSVTNMCSKYDLLQPMKIEY